MPGLVSVSAAATGGEGTAASPWTGWDSAIQWSENTTYLFEPGYYSYSSSPEWGRSGICLRGSGMGSTFLLYTGKKEAAKFDGGPTTDINNITVQDLLISGGKSATVGIYMRRMHRSTFRNVAVWNAGTLIQQIYGVLNEFSNLMLTLAVLPASIRDVNTPTTGLLLQRRDGIEYPTTNVYTNLTIEYVNGTGLLVEQGDQNTFIGGTAENNVTGIDLHMVTSQATLRNVFIGFHMENNSSGFDAHINGMMNTFINCASSGIVAINDDRVGQGVQNVFIGGTYTTILNGAAASYDIGNYAQLNSFENLLVLEALTDFGPLNNIRTHNVAGASPSADYRSSLATSGAAVTVGSLTGVTGSVSAGARSTSLAGIITIAPSNTSASAGTFAVTYASPYATNAPVVVLTLMSGTGGWSSAACAPQITANATTGFTVRFDNNGVNLASGFTFLIAYQVIGQDPTL